MKAFFALTLFTGLLVTPAIAQSVKKSVGKIAMQLPADQVQVASGRLAGTVATDGLRMFKGVPFAAPPVGNLRWQAPQPVQPWKDVRSATQFGPRAMQQPIFGDMNFRSNGVSEDCLYLNVWTPAKSAQERRPVLVY